MHASMKPKMKQPLEMISNFHLRAKLGMYTEHKLRRLLIMLRRTAGFTEKNTVIQ